MKKILVIATGGTIASEKCENSICLKEPFKIIKYYDNKYGDTEFVCKSPFSVLSENMNFDLWKKLIDFIKEQNAENYSGIIILHGSDTLAYTAAIIANAFFDKKICLTAADKPIEDSTSNGIKNFNSAVDFIMSKKTGVFVSYDGIFDAQTITSADGNDKFLCVGKRKENIKNPNFSKKNILIIKPYPGIDFENFNLTGTDAVLCEMYHSATVGKEAKNFCFRCEESGIKFYFVTPKSAAFYETALDIKDKIIFDCTTENAYARLLLKND